MDAADVTAVLAGAAPFAALPREELAALAGRARVQRFRGGEVVLDAFGEPADDVFVVLAGRVELWNDADRIGAGETLGPAGVFGYTAMLTDRSIGPLAVAAGDVTVARLPEDAAAPVFATPEGVRFLAENASAGGRPAYTVVDELIVSAPVVVPPSATLVDVAARLTEATSSCACAVVRLPDGLSLVSDAALRIALARGLPPTATAAEVMTAAPPTVRLGDSAAEALIQLLERDAEYVVVTDRAGEVRGVVAPRDFVVSPATAGVGLSEQILRAASVGELRERAAGVPDLLGDLTSRGMSAGRAITVHSAVLDSVVRRAIQLVLDGYPELSSDAFTWLSLGSNGRREAVPSSDVDSAVAFDSSLSAAEVEAYRPALADIVAVLSAAGLSRDEHGATAANPLFARTNAGWREAGREWLAHPEDGNGAMMTSLLVDGRPIHGDPGLPAVRQVFGELREHPGSMRLLLKASLANRARTRPVRDLFVRRDRFDLKEHALTPIVNLARWAGLAAGTPALPTTERLLSAAGSPMLPDEQARTLVEVFEVLQQVRLRAQLRQVADGDPPSDVVELDRLSAIDRSIITRAVREIASVQRRAANVSQYLAPRAWVVPEGPA